MPLGVLFQALAECKQIRRKPYSNTAPPKYRSGNSNMLVVFVILARDIRGVHLSESSWRGLRIHSRQIQITAERLLQGFNAHIQLAGFLQSPLGCGPLG